MRTTLTLDDEIAAALKKKAFKTGRSFKAIVNETLATGLAATGDQPSGRPYRLQPASLGKPRTDDDLTKALLLAGKLEDDELLRKLEQRK